MYSIILTTLLVTGGLQQPDSIDHQWLTKEWHQMNEVFSFEPAQEGKIFIVSLSENKVVQLNKSALHEFSKPMKIAHQKADFLFSLENDEYYLLDGIMPKAPASEIVQYSSAE
jgi:hypothetical protein